MIRFLEHKEIDKAAWDQHLEACLNPLIYARSWYLDIISPGWAAMVYGDYETFMPLPVKTKFGIKLIIQPPMAQQLGVFYKKSDAQVSALVDAIPKTFRYLHLALNEANDLMLKNWEQIKKTNY